MTAVASLWSTTVSADAVPIPSELAAQMEPSASCEREVVLYVNFDGATLTPAQHEDASTGDSLLAMLVPACAGPYPAYAGSRDAVFQQVVRHWEPFDVTVVRDRPQSGDYTMALVGTGGCVSAGLAVSDCFDMMPSNIVLVSGTGNTTADARLVSQEFGHAFGLGHVADTSDCMHQETSYGDCSFKDSCSQLVGENFCGQQLTVCGDAGVQNSAQELALVLGQGGEDTAPPTLTISQPPEGATFAPGQPVPVVVEPSDDCAIGQVTLTVDDMPVGTLEAPPFQWSLTDLELGAHELSVAVVDGAGLQATAQITIEVVEGGGTSGGVSGGEDTDPTLGDSGFPTSGGLDDSRGDGCGCRVSPGPAPVALGLWVLAVARRRRG